MRIPISLFFTDPLICAWKSQNSQKNQLFRGLYRDCFVDCILIVSWIVSYSCFLVGPPTSIVISPDRGSWPTSRRIKLPNQHARRNPRSCPQPTATRCRKESKSMAYHQHVAWLAWPCSHNGRCSYRIPFASKCVTKRKHNQSPRHPPQQSRCRGSWQPSSSAYLHVCMHVCMNVCVYI